MKKIVIVDGDLIARRAVAKILQEKTDHQLIVSGEPNEAVTIVENVNPDLIIIGIRHDVVEEIAMISALRVRFPMLPIIILSERSEAGAAIAIAGLRLGAIDFITKSTDDRSMLFAERHLSKRLLPVVRSVLRLTKRSEEGAEIKQGGTQFETLDSLWPLNLMVIGGCTGGPAALYKLVGSLPSTFTVPIVIVQHLPKFYTKVLAERLNNISDLDIAEATDGETLKAGMVRFAPGGYHCELFRDSNRTLLRVHRGPRENGVRPSIDVLFRSAGRLYGPGAMGVVLSGCGKDGVAGAGAIRQAGGHIIVQDYRTALIPDLPLAVMQSGNYDLVSPVDHMVELFLKRDDGVLGSV
ncbi:MAG: chemotaxis protein CheB, partial [Balneolaceae bacterium]|nr:chemotaxis protein CheB [Balneolaceae bacterium]